MSEGEVLVDGVDVRQFRLSALRQKIGYIPQKALLFTGTIAENMRYGKEDATQAEMERAAEIAQAAEFIAQTPDGFDAHLQKEAPIFLVDKNNDWRLLGQLSGSRRFIYLMTVFRHWIIKLMPNYGHD